MKKVSEEVQRVLNEAARTVEQLLAVHDGIHGELAATMRFLRDGDLLGVLRANEKMTVEQMTAASLHISAMAKLGEVIAMDPALWKDVSDRLAEDRREAAKQRFAESIEDWDADKCRRALAEHIESCESERCWIAPILEERIARHEPH